ncbi:hypothetical protein LIER_34689 [Lithospermum erythrorhizon]|uniref:Uncharacterized protein n=1 Tax=Lithospermum erythrorhizon TaxID=34254 RepID=A0AAV3S070_LITER
MDSQIEANKVARLTNIGVTTWSIAKADIINVDAPKENMTGTNKKVMNIRDFGVASLEGKSSFIMSASKEDSTQSQKTPSLYEPSSYSKNNMGFEG